MSQDELTNLFAAAVNAMCPIAQAAYDSKHPLHGWAMCLLAGIEGTARLYQQYAQELVANQKQVEQRRQAERDAHGEPPFPVIFP